VATSDPTLVKITAADNSGILLNKDKFRVDSGRHLDPKLMEELRQRFQANQVILSIQSLQSFSWK
jgi:hypothetical protein